MPPPKLPRGQQVYYGYCLAFPQGNKDDASSSYTLKSAAEKGLKASSELRDATDRCSSTEATGIMKMVAFPENFDC